MDPSFASVLDAVVRPDGSNADRILEELGLDRVPPRSQVHREIEDRLLLPKEKLPDHWLPQYQVCVMFLLLYGQVYEQPAHKADAA